MRRLLCPVLVPLFVAALPASGASASPRAATVAAQTISVNGVACLEVVSWSGGAASANVVAEPPVAGASAKKHLGSVAFDPITVEATLPLSKTMLDCIADLCANRTNRKTLLLTNLDVSGRAAGTPLEATEALVTEVRFPAFDAGASEPARVTLVFAVEIVRAAKVASSSAAATAAGRTSLVLTSGFQIDFTGLGGSTVSRIEPFTIKRSITADDIGAARDYQKEPSKVEIPNLSLTFVDAAPADWTAWHADFVVTGNSGDDQEKSGTLLLRAANSKNIQFSLDLSHVGIMRLAFQPGTSGQPGRTRADLYCESMTVGGGASGSASDSKTSPTSSSSNASTTTNSGAETTSAAAGGTAPATPAPASMPAPAATGAIPRAVVAETPVRAAAPTLSPVTAIPAASAPVTTATPNAPAVAAQAVPAPRSESTATQAPRTPVTTVTNPADKGSRDPANFPRPEGTVRTAYDALRQKGYTQENVAYTAQANAETTLAFYETALSGDGWEESSRNENNYGYDGAHQVITAWKKGTRSATITLVDISPGNVDIRVRLEVTS